MPATADVQVGVLFRFRFGVALTHCVASVVASPTADVLLTAAHCIGSHETYRFAPDYTTAGAPRGQWRVVSVHTDAAWQARSDPLDDFAFLTVAPGPSRSARRPVQDVTGAYPLGRAPAPGDAVRVIGYPADRHGARLGCLAVVRATGRYPTVDCPSFTSGTSGSPIISSSGTIVGVVGGREDGGCVADVSYTSPFTAAMQSVLLAAEFDLASSPVPRTAPPLRCGA